MYVIVVIAQNNNNNDNNNNNNGNNGEFGKECMTSSDSSDKCAEYGTNAWSNGICYYCSNSTMGYTCSSISQSNAYCSCSNCVYITTPTPTKAPFPTVPSIQPTQPTRKQPSNDPTESPTNHPTITGTTYCKIRDTTDINDCEWNSDETAAIINGVCYYCKGYYCTLTQSDINGYSQCICTNCQENGESNKKSNTGAIVGYIVGALILVIVIGVIFYFYKKKKGGPYSDLYDSLNS